MATKRVEMDDKDSVWNKTPDNMPVFILTPKDILSVNLVNIWISMASVLETFGKQFNINTIPSGKVQKAIDTRDQMLNWQATNADGVKLPD